MLPSVEYKDLTEAQKVFIRTVLKKNERTGKKIFSRSELTEYNHIIKYDGKKGRIWSPAFITKNQAFKVHLNGEKKALWGVYNLAVSLGKMEAKASLKEWMNEKRSETVKTKKPSQHDSTRGRRAA